MSNSTVGFLQSTLTEIGNSATSAAPSIRQAQHDELTEEVNFEIAQENAGHQLALDSLQAEKDSALVQAGLDDPIIIAALSLAMAQRSQQAWQTVVDADNQPIGFVTHPSGPEWMMGTTIYLDIPSPPDPTPTPPPPPAPPSPPDIELENPYWEGFKGFFSGLKTGAKAITNATVDAGAQVVSLGQWDPPDVWDVDPATDLYYEQSRFFADIGVNAAAAAATGGLAGTAGRVGQAARAVDAMDTAANVINGVQGAMDISENGLSWQNAAQVGIGLIGTAQTAKALKESETAQRLWRDEVGAFGSRDSINALRLQQAHPDLPVRISDSAPTHGILNDSVPLMSGSTGGPALDVFGGRIDELSGNAMKALKHVEAHAVAEMLQRNLKEAVLHINYKTGPCSYCRTGIPELLADDMRLWVAFPDGVGYFTSGGWTSLL